MPVAQFVRSRSQERKCTPWFEVDTHYGCLKSGLGHKGRRMWSRDDSTRKTLTFIGLRVFIDSHLVIAEIENELECAAWENPFSHGRRLEPLINPIILDEVRKRRNRLVHAKQHSNWMPKTALRNRGPVADV